MTNSCCDNQKGRAGQVSWWRRFLFHGTEFSRPSNAALDEVPCYVPPKRSGQIKRILVPTDFSPCSEGALRRALLLARQCGAEMTVLYVVDLNFNPPPTVPVNGAKLRDELWKEGLSQLGQTMLKLMGESVEAQSLIREGLPWEEITKAAREYDLIVIGQRPRKTFCRMFSRQTVKGVLDAAPCPVLVVREKESEAA